ncbi:MAG: hypothetical protein AAF892_00990 [Cyanobacteria bacterium P01_D01_bin.71]
MMTAPKVSDAIADLRIWSVQPTIASKKRPSPQSHPTSTPYHVLLALREMADCEKLMGDSSWLSAPP